MPVPRLSRLLVISLLTVGCGIQPSGESDPTRSAEATSQTAEGAPSVCTTDEYGCAVIQAGSPIVIGTALTLMGPDAARGLDSQYGAQVALNLRGEVVGHAVELVHQDDHCDAEGGTAAATDLALRDSLVAVVGTSCSPSAVPAAEILSASGIVMVSPSNTAPSLSDPDTHRPFYVRVAHNDDAQAAAMAEFACAELGVRTAATIHDGSVHAAQLEATFVAEFEERCRGNVSARAAVQGGQADVARAIEEIAVSSDGASPELLYCPMPADEGLWLLRQASRTAGMQDALLAGLRTGLDGRGGSAALDGRDAVDGMYLSGADLRLSGQFYERIFLPEYARISGMEAPLAVFHGHAYDAVNLVLDAVERVAIPTEDALYVPRQELLEAVRSTEDYHGLTGVLSCDEFGDCADVVIAVWQVQGGEFQPVWP